MPPSAALLVFYAVLKAHTTHAEEVESDVAVYGATVCGVSAAVAAARADPSARVLLIVNGTRLGGMTSGGLGGRDCRMDIGGIASEIWATLGANFEPHAAEAAIQAVLDSANATVETHRNAGWITRVSTSGSAPRRITAFETQSGLHVSARVFVDCSYEGDLLRLSGTDYAIGRESKEEFNESLAGIDGQTHPRVGVDQSESLFLPEVSPWADPENTTLLPGILGVDRYNDSQAGNADAWPMSYCFRMCLTDNQSNAIPITQPDGYSSLTMELLRRQFRAWAKRNTSLTLENLFLIRRLPNQKIDLNSGQFDASPFSTDMPFLQHNWPKGNATERSRIFAQHVWWTRALLYFLAHDDAVRGPYPAIAASMASYGLCADEFVETGHWPPQLYIRESVRLRGAVVLAQGDVAGDAAASGRGGTGRWTRSVGLSSWGVDIHAVMRVVVETPKGSGLYRVANAGGHDTFKSKDPPLAIAVVEIPYEAITPRANDTANLLVPVCASFTHVAFSTYRLEPQYAIFGQSAGVAAVMAAKTGVSVQYVNVTALQDTLKAQGQIIHVDNTAV